MTNLLRTYFESTLYENLVSHDEFKVGCNTQYDATENTIDVANVLLRIDIGDYKCGNLISKLIIDVDEYSIGILGHNVSHTHFNFYNFKLTMNVEDERSLTMKLNITSTKPFYSCESGESCVYYTDEDILCKYGYVEIQQPKKKVKSKKKISKSKLRKIQQPITVPPNIYHTITHSPKNVEKCSNNNENNEVEYDCDEEYEEFNDINEDLIT